MSDEQVCGKDDDNARTLLCDQCDAEYHMACLMPPLNTARSALLTFWLLWLPVWLCCVLFG